ncbi:CrcB protein [Haloactinopolyspora alba]|uniref:Fluoride-specific ion channel FluC n=1 Tax=Haloactinopolyspora alba TaxID=648780 RepID=A0A2P8DRI3_9ACTN|nr:CrcB protein [Haloactinopolyspora alba]
MIAAGGVLGAEARYGLGVLADETAVSSGWPWATFVQNVTGCLLIGAVMAVLLDLTAPHRLARPFLGVGVLGGYTTFSTYAVDVQQMLGDGRAATALLYLAGTPIAAVLAVWTGSAAARAAARAARRRPHGHGGDRA